MQKIIKEWLELRRQKNAAQILKYLPAPIIEVHNTEASKTKHEGSIDFFRQAVKKAAINVRSDGQYHLALVFDGGLAILLTTPDKKQGMKRIRQLAGFRPDWVDYTRSN